MPNKSSEENLDIINIHTMQENLIKEGCLIPEIK